METDKYFTGEPCKRGHIAKRYTKSKDCVECMYIRGRESQLKNKFNITLEEYNDILKTQDHKCGICGLTDDPVVKGKAFAVDHCHESNEIRGLLCSRCNQALGHLGDNLEGVNKALEYLNKGFTGKFLTKDNINNVKKARRNKDEELKRYKKKRGKLSRR